MTTASFENSNQNPEKSVKTNRGKIKVPNVPPVARIIPKTDIFPIADIPKTGSKSKVEKPKIETVSGNIKPPEKVVSGDPEIKEKAVKKIETNVKNNPNMFLRAFLGVKNFLANAGNSLFDSIPVVDINPSKNKAPKNRTADKTPKNQPKPEPESEVGIKQGLEPKSPYTPPQDEDIIVDVNSELVQEDIVEVHQPNQQPEDYKDGNENLEELQSLALDYKNTIDKIRYHFDIFENTLNSPQIDEVERIEGLTAVSKTLDTLISYLKRISEIPEVIEHYEQQKKQKDSFSNQIEQTQSKLETITSDLPENLTEKIVEKPKVENIDDKSSDSSIAKPVKKIDTQKSEPNLDLEPKLTPKESKLFDLVFSEALNSDSGKNNFSSATVEPGADEAVLTSKANEEMTKLQVPDVENIQDYDPLKQEKAELEEVINNLLNKSEFQVVFADLQLSAQKIMDTQDNKNYLSYVGDGLSKIIDSDFVQNFELLVSKLDFVNQVQVMFITNSLNKITSILNDLGTVGSDPDLLQKTNPVDLSILGEQLNNLVNKLYKDIFGLSLVQLQPANSSSESIQPTQNPINPEYPVENRSETSSEIPRPIKVEKNAKTLDELKISTISTNSVEPVVTKAEESVEAKPFDINNSFEAEPNFELEAQNVLKGSKEVFEKWENDRQKLASEGYDVSWVDNEWEESESILQSFVGYNNLVFQKDILAKISPSFENNPPFGWGLSQKFTDVLGREVRASNVLDLVKNREADFARLDDNGKKALGILFQEIGKLIKKELNAYFGNKTDSEIDNQTNLKNFVDQSEIAEVEKESIPNNSEVLKKDDSIVLNPTSEDEKSSNSENLDSLRFSETIQDPNVDIEVFNTLGDYIIANAKYGLDMIDYFEESLQFIQNTYSLSDSDKKKYEQIVGRTGDLKVRNSDFLQQTINLTKDYVEKNKQGLENDVKANKILKERNQLVSRIIEQRISVLNEDLQSLLNDLELKKTENPNNLPISNSDIISQNLGKNQQRLQELTTIFQQLDEEKGVGYNPKSVKEVFKRAKKIVSGLEELEFSNSENRNPSIQKYNDLLSDLKNTLKELLKNNDSNSVSEIIYHLEGYSRLFKNLKEKIENS
jgi:hypothetical protein